MLIQLRPRKPERPEPFPRPRRGGLNLILKTTNICNIACKYCSVGPAGRDVLSSEDLELVAQECERIVESWGLRNFTLTFHGGEPSTMGADWLERACQRFQKLPIPVRFNMQTNLYQVTDSFLKVAAAYEIALGSSIDPICGERIAINGEDTWTRWKKNYERVSAAGFRVGGIFVVTKAASTRARELYMACEELNQLANHPFGVQLNAVYPQGRAEDMVAEHDLNVTPQDYGRFLSEIFQVWEERGRSIHINPVENLVRAFASGGQGETGLPCTFRKGCATTHVGVDYKLNVAGCGRRLDSEAYFGNLHHGHLDTLLEESDEQRFKWVRAERLLDSECRGCRFVGVCHGGCPDEASLTNGDYRNKSAWCESYLMLFHAIEQRHGSVGKLFAEMRDGEKKMPDVTIQLGHGVTDFSDRPATRHHELWVLPRADGSLGMEDAADVERLLDGGPSLVRFWLPNARAYALNGLQDALRDPRAIVVLYELQGIHAALNLLNALRLRVTLDLPSIVASPTARHELLEVFERFVSDPLWKVQVGPFSNLMTRAMKRETAPPTNRWGMVPGGYGVSRALGLKPPPALERMVEALIQAQPDGLEYWPQSHGGCRGCVHKAMCGGQFADGDGQPCRTDLLQLVQSVSKRAHDILKFEERLAAGTGS